MKKLLSCFILLLIIQSVFAQRASPVIDSFKRELAKATTVEMKVKLNGYLARLMMGVDSAQAEEYGATAIQVAEE
ncbi:MAG: hypothetical protein EOO88_60025, partial [Pedobacter sp.]